MLINKVEIDEGVLAPEIVLGMRCEVNGLIKKHGAGTGAAAAAINES